MRSKYRVNSSNSMFVKINERGWCEVDLEPHFRGVAICAGTGHYPGNHGKYKVCTAGEFKAAYKKAVGKIKKAI